MLTRRNLIRVLASLFVAAAGGSTLWQLWRSKRAPRLGQPAASELPSGERPLHAFFLLSDIHMNTGNSDMETKLHLALRDVARFEAPVDSIVLGGDLVDGGREGDYDLLKRILSEYSLPPVYGLMGNHEYYHIWYNDSGDWSSENGPNAGKTDAQARERFMRFMGYKDRPYHDVWIGGVHLVMLSQEAYVQERPEVGEGAWYSDQQLAWLTEIMQPHADGKPAFIFIHQPLPPAGSEGGQHRLIRAQESRTILAPYRNTFVFSGHTHRNLETEGRYVRDAAFHWFSNASVGRTRGAGSVSRPVQGLYVQVFPDRVLVRGREFSNRSWIKAAEWPVALVP